MTGETTPDRERMEASDHVEYEFQYDHGRMPLFMKLIWIGALTFFTWYVAVFLLEAVSQDLGV